MILETYIFIECLALLFFLIGLFRRMILSWVISLVLFGAQVMSSYSITNYVYTIQINGSTVATTFTNSYPEMAYINMLFFAVALIIGISDMVLNRHAGQQIS
jgi:hypothetical protein